MNRFLWFALFLLSQSLEAICILLVHAPDAITVATDGAMISDDVKGQTVRRGTYKECKIHHGRAAYYTYAFCGPEDTLLRLADQITSSTANCDDAATLFRKNAEPAVRDFWSMVRKKNPDVYSKSLKDHFLGIKILLFGIEEAHPKWVFVSVGVDSGPNGPVTTKTEIHSCPSITCPGRNIGVLFL